MRITIGNLNDLPTWTFVVVGVAGLVIGILVLWANL